MPFFQKIEDKIATAGFGSSFKLRRRGAVGGFLRLLLRHVACNIKHALRQIPGAGSRFLGFDSDYSCIIFPLSIACLTPQIRLVQSALAAMLLHQELSRQTCLLFCFSHFSPSCMKNALSNTLIISKALIKKSLRAYHSIRLAISFLRIQLAGQRRFTAEPASIK